MPETGWLINNRNAFLTVLKAEKFKIEALADLVSSQVLPPGSQSAIFLLCPHITEGVRELPRCLFMKTVISFVKVSTLTTSSPPKTPPSNRITLRMRFQHVNLGETHAFSLSQGVTKFRLTEDFAGTKCGLKLTKLQNRKKKLFFF